MGKRSKEKKKEVVEESDNLQEEEKGESDNEKDAADDDQEQQQKRRRKRKRKRGNKEKEDADDDANDGGDDVDKNKDSEPEAPMNAVDQKKTLEVDRTIYIEGIPFTCSEQDVRDFFTKHELTKSLLTDVRLPVWQDSGRLRGYGHIVLDTEETYKKALALSGEYMGQRYVTIQAAQKPKQASSATTTTVDPNVNPSKTLILNNLSYNATEDDVNQVLEKYGSIADGGVRVVRHSQTGRSKGFAYVEFVNQEDAISVVKNASKLAILSRPCRVDYDHGRVRGSFRTADRKLWHKEYNNDDESNHGKGQRS